MREPTYPSDPTESLEPWLPLNRTNNPYLMGGIESKRDEEEWAQELMTTVGKKSNLLPDLLAALDQVRWKAEFVDRQLPYLSGDDVGFTTKVNMNPEWEFNPQRRSWVSPTVSFELQF